MGVLVDRGAGRDLGPCLYRGDGWYLANPLLVRCDDTSADLGYRRAVSVSPLDRIDQDGVRGLQKIR